VAAGCCRLPLDRCCCLLYRPCLAQFEVPETQRQLSLLDLFYVHKHTKCPLSSKDALSMLLHIIENPDGGANLNLGALTAEKKINVRRRCACSPAVMYARQIISMPDSSQHLCLVVLFVGGCGVNRSISCCMTSAVIRC
jgi:hypothetical protein